MCGFLGTLCPQQTVIPNVTLECVLESLLGDTNQQVQTTP